MAFSQNKFPSTYRLIAITKWNKHSHRFSRGFLAFILNILRQLCLNELSHVIKRWKILSQWKTHYATKNESVFFSACSLRGWKLHWTSTETCEFVQNWCCCRMINGKRLNSLCIPNISRHSNSIDFLYFHIPLPPHSFSEKQTSFFLLLFPIECFHIWNRCNRNSAKKFCSIKHQFQTIYDKISAETQMGAEKKEKY